MVIARNHVIYLVMFCCLGVAYVIISNEKMAKLNEGYVSKFASYNVKMNKIDEKVPKVRKKRLPDIIGIGTEKCGSGALQFYLRKHPLIRVGAKETHFFTRYAEEANIENYLEIYKNSLARATDEEFIMEKTPAYFNFKPNNNIPGKIKSHVPNAKIWVILCDPTKRLFSDFVHEKNTGVLVQDFEFKKYIEPRLEWTTHELMKQADDDKATSSYINEQMSRSYLSHIYLTGLYYYHLKQWFRYYNETNFIIVDGENLIENPFEEVSKVEKFMGLPSFFKREHFVLNETTGFYCVHVNESMKSDGSPPCLGGRKGNTRKKPEMWEDYKDTLDKIRQFYKPYNDKLFKMLNRTFDW